MNPRSKVKSLIKKAMKMPNRKGQITIIAIIVTVITLLVFGAMLPVLQVGIDLVKAATNDTALELVVDLIPLFLGLGIIIAILTYTTVQRPAE